VVSCGELRCDVEPKVTKDGELLVLRPVLAMLSMPGWSMPGWSMPDWSLNSSLGPPVPGRVGTPPFDGWPVITRWNVTPSEE